MFSYTVIIINKISSERMFNMRKNLLKVLCSCSILFCLNTVNNAYATSGNNDVSHGTVLEITEQRDRIWKYQYPVINYKQPRYYYNDGYYHGYLTLDYTKPGFQFVSFYSGYIYPISGGAPGPSRIKPQPTILSVNE